MTAQFTIMRASDAQQRIWFEWQLDPQFVAYNNPLLYHLSGDLDPKLMEKTLQHIVNEQPALRSFFLMQAGVLRQFVQQEVAMDLDYHELNSLDAETKAKELEKIIHHNVRRPFLLDKLPLFRFSLIRVTDREYWLVLNIHHVVVDGYSASKLIKNISEYYQAGEHSFNQLDATYQRYFTNFAEKTQNLDDEKHFWQTQLQDAEVQIGLHRKEAPEVLSENGVRDYFAINKDLTNSLKQLAKKLRTTEFNLLLGAYVTVLSRFANQDDLIIGYPVDIRPAYCKDLYGFFVNNLPFRLRMQIDDTLTTLIKQINEQRKRIKPYQTTDLGNIMRYVRPLFAANPESLFQVSLVRANFALEGLDLPNIKVTPHLISTGEVKDELCLLYDDNETFQFALEYKTALFDLDYIEQFKAAFIECLESICVVDVNAPLSDISLFNICPPKALESLLTEDDCVIRRFIKHTNNSPDKIVIYASNANLTYKELYTKVINLCSAWHEKLSAANPVIVCLSRTPDLIATLLTLQWLGVAYVPVEPKISKERLKFIIKDSNASAIIVDETIDEIEICVLNVNSLLKTAWSANTYPSNTKETLAYIIYTSGSTGTPKGVAINRLALNNFLKSMASYFMHEMDAMLLAITTIGFDIAGLEIYLPIWQGKSLYLANDKEHKDPLALNTILLKNPITYLQATPAMWQMLLEVGLPNLANLIALCGGDALTSSLASQLSPKIKTLWNLYGPTEATVWCALKEIKAFSDITVGKPIANMQMYVMDKRLRPMPAYIKGELFISGIGLATGYVNREDLNQSQFILGPDRLYRVGDLAYTTKDNEFVIVGRTDNQVKLNGFRIELGEIEARLLMLAGINKAAVILVDKQLVAYICTNLNNLTEEYIALELANFLPDYMVPKRFIFLDKLPLNANGKVDRKYLATLKLSNNEVLFNPPVTEYEKRLSLIWQKVLGIESISVTTHFYSLGGYSLLSVQLTMAINREFMLNLSLSDVLNSPTIRQQAKIIECQKVVLKPESASLPKILPLLNSQYRIWLATTTMQVAGQYNMAAKISFKGSFDLERFKQVFLKLVAQHEALSLKFIWQDAQIWQQIGVVDTFDILELKETWNQWATQVIELDKAPLWRLAFKRVDENTTEIGWVMHHLIADGYSVGVLLQDLFDLYHGKTLKPQTNSYFAYVQYCIDKVRDKNSINFWQNELLGCSHLHLPYDKDHPRDGRGQSYISQISNENYLAINDRCRQEGILNSTYFIGVFALLLNQSSKQTDFCIGLPVVNREHWMSLNLMGCFMEVMPLRMILTKDPFWQWLKHLEENIITCRSNPLSFELDIDSKHLPVVLNIQNSPFNASIEPIWTNTCKYDLSLEIYVGEEESSLRWEYATSLFMPKTIMQMDENYINLLTECLDSSLVAKLEHKVVIKNTLGFVHKVYIPPKTTLQKIMARTWETLFQQGPISLDEHFFKFGGHSLLAAKLVTLLYKDNNINVPLDLIFKHPILEDYCEAIANYKNYEQEDLQLVGDILPLTPNQRQIVLSLQNQTDGPKYQIGVLLENIKVFDITKLQSAFEVVLNAHSIYRWQLVPHAMHAVFAPTINFKIENYITGIEETKINPHIAPLIKVGMFKNQVLVIVHHLIADEWSLHALLDEVLAVYNNSSASLKTSAWEKNLQRFILPIDHQTKYWVKKLETWSPARLLPTMRKKEDNSAILSLVHKVDATIVSQLIEKANQAEATLYHVLLTKFIEIMFLLSDLDKFDFVVTMDRRGDALLQELHGYLVNLIPWSVTRDKSFTEQLAFVKQQQIEFMEVMDLDFAALMEKGAVKNPYVVFNFQHSLSLGDNQISWQPIRPKHSPFPLTINLRFLEGELEIDIEYQVALYHATYIDLIMQMFKGSILEQNQSLPCTLLRKEVSLLSQLNNVVLMHANNIAISHNGLDVTYQKLFQDVGSMSAALGLNSNIVAVHTENKYLYVVAILAVLQVGATFLGIDPSLPLQRKSDLLKDCAAKIIITDLELDFSNTCKSLRIDQILTSVSPLVSASVEPHSPAYLIYTSGTTGKPKATVISHQALLSFILALKDKLQITHLDRVLQFSSCSFDASIWEIFLTLMSGATLIIPNAKERRVGINLQQFIQQSKITHAILTPSVLNNLNPELVRSLKSIASGGETCNVNLVDKWASVCEFYNAYGPSEATVCVTLHRFHKGDNPNFIGRPLGKSRLKVIARDLSTLPAGSIGELCISGPILALNYLNQPELTAKSFIEIDGERWYRTGDKVRLVGDDCYEFLGRLDRQIKLRGIRIELAEIEQALLAIEGILAAYCLVKDERLYAFILTKRLLSEESILNILATALPKYMLPNKILQLDEIPILPSGKINSEKLNLIAEQSAVKPTITKKLPENATEVTIHNLWCEILQLAEIDVSDNFFALGGNSLQAMNILSRLEDAFQTTLDMSFFYAHGSIRQQRDYLMAVTS